MVTNRTVTRSLWIAGLEGVFGWSGDAVIAELAAGLEAPLLRRRFVQGEEEGQVGALARVGGFGALRLGWILGGSDR